MTQNPNLNRHIFLVDDDQEDRELFSEALSLTNIKTHLTQLKSGMSLIETLNDPDFPTPEIIFLDLNMPKLNGIDCLKKIKASPKHRDLKIVMLSTYSNADEIEQAYKEGANRYYVKPTLFDNLVALISGALDNQNHNDFLTRKNFLVHYPVQPRLV